ncbi:MAG TPA: prolipoprotein diacylglyceryl transferase [Phycisphaerales bacterium]|nr:prolipoprotein diacylglyceryl transferase [Phycisphaerales bacterium]HMP38044.1 prolipoprotein diacylglyceryl transferase [Phycisphaerales bacterium]
MLLAQSYVNTLDPVALPIAGEFAIRWYGLAYLIGFLAGYLLLRRLLRSGRMGMPPELLDDFVTTMIVAVLVGGRLGHVLFYDRPMLWAVGSSFPFWEPLAFWRGGMSSHGGILGVILGCFWWGRRRGVPGWHALDLVAFVCPIGLGLGRLANFINGELVGRALPESLRDAPPWWSVKYPGEILERGFPIESLAPLAENFDAATRATIESSRDPAWSLAVAVYQGAIKGTPSLVEGVAPLLTPRYPSQLAQAFTDGILLPIALAVVWRRPRVAGVVSAWFAIAYGALRFLTEQIREIDEGVWIPMGLTLPMWLSLILVGVGIVLLLTIGRRSGPIFGGAWGPAGSTAAAVHRRGDGPGSDPLGG